MECYLTVKEMAIDTYNKCDEAPELAGVCVCVLGRSRNLESF